MNDVTLEVILRVVFGVTDERRLAALRPRVRATVDVSPVVLLGWGYPRLQRFGPWKRTVDNAYELDRLIYAEIRERRAAPDLATRGDVLSQLVRVDDDGDTLSDEELRDQLVTLLLAGHETTASALAWALHEVGRDPDQRRRATQAAREGDDDWLEAVLKEAMRLHPVIPMVSSQLGPSDRSTLSGTSRRSALATGVVISSRTAEARRGSSSGGHSNTSSS